MLQVSHLNTQYKDGQGRVVKAAQDINIEVPKGKMFTLLGPSGCGKTTTMRSIAGMEKPTSGRITVNGKVVYCSSSGIFVAPNKRNFGMVFQSYAIWPHMNVFQNAAFPLEVGPRKFSRREIEERVMRVLTVVGLENIPDREATMLSGGQQQRLALARALVMEPQVLLFDEPLSNLDAKLRVQMRGEIHALQRRLNITSVYVTHDQVEAMALSDRIVVMNAGRIEQIGTPDEIYRRPNTRFVADFIGRANFIDTTVVQAQGERVTVELFGTRVELQSNGRSVKPGERQTAVVRPEGLKLRADPTLEQVLIEQAMYLGSEIEYIVRAGDQRLVVVDSDPRTSQIFPEGETVGLDIIGEAVHLLPPEETSARA